MTETMKLCERLTEAHDRIQAGYDCDMSVFSDAVAALKERDALKAERDAAESTLDASRRQVEGLREDLERIHSAADEGSYRGCPHCLQVMGMIDDALSALDAPQPEARDAIIAEAVGVLVVLLDDIELCGVCVSDEPREAARAFVEKHAEKEG